MLNMRTRSARASPALASRWCSASASSALVLYTSPICALTPVAAIASRSARNDSGCGVTSSGTITADGAPRGTAGRRVGQHGPDPGGIAPPAVVDPRRADVQVRVVHAQHGRDVGGGTGQAVVADARHREDERRGALGQAGGHRAPVAAARLDQPGMRLPDREIVRRRRRGLWLRLVLERRVPGAAGGQTRREVGYVAHISEA